MKKIINLTIITLLFIACETHEQEPYAVTVENKTNDTLKAELFNVWSGKTDTIIYFSPGKTNLTGENLKLTGFFINGYPEKTLLFREHTRLTFTPEKFKTDSVNHAISEHQKWSQQLATRESTETFIWPAFAIKKVGEIEKWQEFDNILWSLFTDSTYQIENKRLESKAFHIYPAAYMLLHKYTDTSGTWIKTHINHVINKLEKAGVQEKTQETFLLHYLRPEKPSLINDSAIIALKSKKPAIAEKLSGIYEKIKENSKILPGKPLPKIFGTSADGKRIELTYTTKWTLIDFWATWCIPCIKQLPELNDYAKNHNRILKIVSISVDSKKDYNKWLEQARSTPHIEHIWISDTTSIRENLGIRGLPRMILVNSDGKVTDANFPHLSNPLSKLWIKQLVAPANLADKKP